MLIVDPGQRIRLLLKGYYTSASSSTAQAGHSDNTCVEIGAVLADGGQTVVGVPTAEGRERTGQPARQPIIVCRTELGQKDRSVYLSETNRVALALTVMSPDDVYLMAFEGIALERDWTLLQ